MTILMNAVCLHSTIAELGPADFLGSAEERLSCLSLSAQADGLTKAAFPTYTPNIQRRSLRTVSIQSLPVEILSTVLILSQTPSQDALLPNALDTARGPWLLTHVSQEWRRISISTPSLWCTIHVQLLSHLTPEFIEFVLRTLISRSGNLPLDLHLQGVGSSAHFWERRARGECVDMRFPLAAKIFLEQRARWNIVEIQGPLQDIMIGLVTGGDFPSLQVLSLVDWAPLASSGGPDLSCGSFDPSTHFPCNACLEQVLQKAPRLGLLLVHAVFEDAGAIMQLANTIHGEWGGMSKASIKYTTSNTASPTVVLLENQEERRPEASICPLSSIYPVRLGNGDTDEHLSVYEGWLPSERDGWTTVAAVRPMSTSFLSSAAEMATQGAPEDYRKANASRSRPTLEHTHAHCTARRHTNAATAFPLPCTSKQITDLTVRLSSGTSHTSHLPAFFAYLQLPNLVRVEIDVDAPLLAVADIGTALGMVIRGMGAPAARAARIIHAYPAEELHGAYEYINRRVDTASMPTSTLMDASGASHTSQISPIRRGGPHRPIPLTSPLRPGLITALTVHALDSYGFPQVLLQLEHIRILRLIELRGCTDVIRALGKVAGVMYPDDEDEDVSGGACEEKDVARADPAGPAPIYDTDSTHQDDRIPRLLLPGSAKMLLCPSLTRLEILDPPSLNLRPVHFMLHNRSKVAEAAETARLADDESEFDCHPPSMRAFGPRGYTKMGRPPQIPVKLESVVIRGGYVHPRATLSEWVKYGVVVFEDHRSAFAGSGLDS